MLSRASHPLSICDSGKSSRAAPQAALWGIVSGDCRRVALTMIKPGMDTRQVIARFEAERQALAMMDAVGPALGPGWCGNWPRRPRSRAERRGSCETFQNPWPAFRADSALPRARPAPSPSARRQNSPGAWWPPAQGLRAGGSCFHLIADRVN
jgi:hypothetical protein